MSRLIWSAVILSAAAMGVCGCGRGGGQSGGQSKEAEHIRHASTLVAMYTVAAKKQPTKMEEVRDWAVKEGKGAAEDFVSTRDNELYVIDFSGQGIGLREQTGKNGKCYVMRMGNVTEVPAQDTQRGVGDPRLKQTKRPG
jgi:hypothetical protein